MPFICWEIEVNIFDLRISLLAMSYPEKCIYHLKNSSSPRAFTFYPFRLKFGTYVFDIIAVISCYVTIFEILLLTLFMRLTVLKFGTRIYG